MTVQAQFRTRRWRNLRKADDAMKTIPTLDENRVIDLIEEQPDFLVLHKPEGLLSVPGKTLPDCMEARVQNIYPEALTVHRLDMATSGVCVMARGKANLAHLQQQFEKRQTTKSYESVVWGAVEDDAGTIDAAIRCDWPNRPLQMIDNELGRRAITHWKVMERHGNRTRVALFPVTGRSHQLRLHMKTLGHPILGDPWYADGQAQVAASRLLLHARSLGFRSPSTGEDVIFSSPCPF